MKILKVFTDYKLFEILLLGAVSGMPLAIIFTTFTACLKDADIDIAIITSFAVARMPYSLKVFWAPFVDNFQIPLVSKFGHRKSWMLLCTILIAATLFAISNYNPTDSLTTLYFLLILLGVLSATFDINVDAFRIEKFDKDSQAIATSSCILGYRLGMLITGAGALYFSEITNSWHLTFIAIAIIFIFAAIFIMTVTEENFRRELIKLKSFISLIQIAFVPFREFFTRKYAITILLAVIFFKLGDAMLAVVSIPFYMELGYSKAQIGLISKFYGLIATLLGSVVGGMIVYRIGTFKGLVVTGIVQSLTHFAFIWLNHQAPSSEALMIAITIENFAAATGATALVAYISNLCNRTYSASQYALLSSSASLFNNTVTIYGGSLVKMLGWDNFFILTIILALPGLAILVYLNRIQKY